MSDVDSYTINDLAPRVRSVRASQRRRSGNGTLMQQLCENAEETASVEERAMLGEREEGRGAMDGRIVALWQCCSAGAP
jgi:hypothetical protein